MEALRQYRWAMLEASRHLDMNHKTIKVENKQIHREKLQELQAVKAKIKELETGIPSKKRLSTFPSFLSRKSVGANSRHLSVMELKEQDMKRREEVFINRNKKREGIRIEQTQFGIDNAMNLRNSRTALSVEAKVSSGLERQQKVKTQKATNEENDSPLMIRNVPAIIVQEPSPPFK